MIKEKIMNAFAAQKIKILRLKDRIAALEADNKALLSGQPTEVNDRLAYAAEAGWLAGANEFKLVFAPEDGGSHWPDEMCDKPFCNVHLFRDDGDASVGIGPRAYLALDDEQGEDTWLGQYLATKR